jgi:capsular polysaccharide transport system permease protein
MSLARGLHNQLEVVHALILRETKTRFGVYRLGYLWAFIEPLLWIGTFYVMFTLVNRKAPFGMDTVSFMATGIVPYLMFREAAGRAMSAIDANKALLFYPQVRPLDLIFARASLEFATFTLVLLVLLFGNGLVRGELTFESLSQTLVALALGASLGFGLGLTLCSLRVFFPSVAQLTGPLMRPLFWASGLFFTANDLPSGARNALLWNPVLHIIELVRDGWFLTYTSRYASVTYPVLWIVVLIALGLTLERVARRSIETT